MARSFAQRLSLKWYNFKQQIRGFNTNTPPNWLQTWSQLSSIILGGISVALASWAIWLTIKISNQQQEVKNMGEVLSELVTQNKKLDKEIAAQNSQITQLKEISDRSVVNSVDCDPGVPGDVDPTFQVGEEQ